MSFISEIRNDVKLLGAKEVATRLAEALKEKKLSYRDMPTHRQLYEALVVKKGNDKEVIGKDLLESTGIHGNDQKIAEEAASYTDISGFNVLGSQIYFNAFTSRYNPSEWNVSPTFRVVNTSLFLGEKAAGLTNLNAMLAPVPSGDPLPAVTFSQDYEQTPALQQHGAVLNITFPMMAGDQSGQIMMAMEKLADLAYTQRELEAVATLTDLNSNRTRYNWLPKNGVNSVYGTYQSSSPWINVSTSNGLVGLQSLNSAWEVLAAIVDPFTSLPIVTAPSPWKLFVTPSNQFTAQRIARQIEYRYIDTQGSNYENSIADGMAGLPFSFEVVSSKYLAYWLTQNSGAQTTWYIGQPEESFYWFRALDVNLAQAVDNAGELFTRSLAAAYKYVKWETSYCFNPRFMCQATA